MPIEDQTRRLSALSARLQAGAGRAEEWLAARTPTGYPTTAGGGAAIGTSEPSSPTLTAIVALPELRIGDSPLDLRAIHARIALHVDGAIAHAEMALRYCDAVPRAPSGQQAAQLDYEARTSRCEGWGPLYAVCEDLAVQGSVVDGSTMRLCHRCYLAMWRQTDGLPKGGRAARPAVSPRENEEHAMIRDTGAGGRP